jgi:hypothetical protein
MRAAVASLWPALLSSSSSSGGGPLAAFARAAQCTPSFAAALGAGAAFLLGNGIVLEPLRSSPASTSETKT